MAISTTTFVRIINGTEINTLGTITTIFNIGQSGASAYQSYLATTTDDPKLTEAEWSAGFVQLQSDWNQSENTKKDFIKNKPSIPTKTSELTNDSDFVSDADYVHTDNNYDDAAVAEVAKIADKANSADVYTKSETYSQTEINNKLSAVYKFKGSVLTYDLLPIDAENADVWNVVNGITPELNGMNYAWNSTLSAWDAIGGIVGLATLTENGLMSKEDFAKLSDLYTKEDLDLILADKSPTSHRHDGETIIPDVVEFQTPATTPTAIGSTYYDAANKVLSTILDGAVLQNGLEMYVRVVNKTGVQINDGQAVYISGAQGNRPTATLAKADAAVTSEVIGVATMNIPNNQEGFVTVFGSVDYNTTGITDGAELYLSGTVAGALTEAEPAFPLHKVVVATALNSTNNGKIFVRPYHIFELAELHGVDLTETTPLDTDSVIIQQTTTGKVKKTLFSTLKTWLLNAGFLNKYEAEQEALYSYGVLIDNRFSSPIVTRVGNLELHKTLPVQSLMRGCLLLDNGTVNYYLKPTDWTKKVDESASVLDGSDGQVMVEISEYYVKYKTIDQNQTEVRISLQPLTGYILKPKCYVSAYKASLQRSNNKLSSVINLTTDFRGGNNDATNDANSKSYLGKPVTSKNLTDFRTYARNRAAGTRWNCMTYDIRKSLYWLFVIEYANLNSQAAVVGRNTVTGYMDGGLGNGMTTANGTEWNTFNGYYPFVPCGASNSLGNGSGEVNYVAADFGGAGVNRTFTIPRYRGVESPFGDIWEWTDGILVDVKTDASGGTSALYTSNTPANFSSTSFAAYIMRGLLPRTEGYVRNIIFGVDGDIMPQNVVGGGSTTYYCDNFWRDINSNAIRGVLFGGYAAASSVAGFVAAHTGSAPSNAFTYVGSRLCFV